MGTFQRSPSKVWWAEDNTNNSVSWRSASASSGSQDSGFSDAENSPTAQQAKQPDDKTQLEQSLAKGANSNENMNQQNLSSNIKEKETPQKSIPLRGEKQIPKKGDFNRSHVLSYQLTPKTIVNQAYPKTAPVTRSGCQRHPQRVNRNLFKSAVTLNRNANEIVHNTDQYSKQHSFGRTQENLNAADYNVAASSNSSFDDNESFELPQSVKSLPILSNGEHEDCYPINLSAPAVLSDEEGLTPFNISSGDSDSELECLFRDDMVSPQHTSTPKTNHKNSERLSLRRKFTMNLLLKYQQNNRVPPTQVVDVDDRADLQFWMSDIKNYYEPECMTALQCKSIAGELSEKVNNFASALTLRIRDILNYQKVIQQEFDNIKDHKKHIRPLMQSLCGLVIEFLKKYSMESNCPLKQLCETIKVVDEIEINKLLSKFNLVYKSTQQKILTKEVKRFIDELEEPCSEIHFRALLTGLTSIALRNEELISLFTKEGAIQILVIFCEKCEGSTVRALTFRALSTICTRASAVRQFEQVSGVQVLVETIIDESRPEPERSEAVALLAQISSPWIEDNHNVSGLVNYDKKLVKALTKFISSTKCCQNLLLCTAALAHLTTMENNSIRYILYYNTISILLRSIKARGPRASIYLLEQAATLLANVSAVDEARKLLVRDGAPSALLCFLQPNCSDDDLIRRLQQKSVVALSRLCSEPEAAKKIVELGGVNRLIEMCREKEERSNSDAILVAALVTLRKVIDTCGTSVMSSQDVQELIQPRLLDSFLAYATQNESYV